MELDELLKRLGTLMTSMTNLLTARDDLKAEVVQFLTDIKSALSGPNPQIDKVTSDIESQVAALKAGDPLNVPTSTVPTSTSTVPTSTVPTSTVPTSTVPTSTVPTSTGTTPTGTF